MAMTPEQIARWAQEMLDALLKKYPEIEEHEGDLDDHNLTREIAGERTAVALAKFQLAHLSDDPIEAAMRYGECYGALLATHALTKLDLQKYEWIT